MIEKTRHCVQTNSSAFARLAAQKSRAGIDAWFFVLIELAQCGRPSGPQLVDLSRSPKRIRSALPELVKVGLLRPHRTAESRFYVPRGVASAI